LLVPMTFMYFCLMLPMAIPWLRCSNDAIKIKKAI